MCVCMLYKICSLLFFRVKKAQNMIIIVCVCVCVCICSLCLMLLLLLHEKMDFCMLREISVLVSVCFYIVVMLLQTIKRKI